MHMTSHHRLAHLDLDHCTLIGRGANRVCVEHPDDRHLCIKIDLPQQPAATTSLAGRLKAWFSNLLPDPSLAHLEFRSNRKIQAALGPAFAGHFAQALEVVPLALGCGLVCERIYNADGTPSQSVDFYLRNPSTVSADVIVRALEEFEAFLLRHDIPLFDLNAGNMLIQFTGAGARAVCIDTKSLGKAKEILPLANWFKAIRQQKISRRFGRLKNKVVRILGARANAPGH